MNSFQGKQILAMVRHGDFAHAGEEEAIERALREVPKDCDQQILDAGCGRGGTAAYMQYHGWGRVTGIDVEPKSIAHAREAYPELTFVCCDINEVAKHLKRCFDVITLFNAGAERNPGRRLAARSSPELVGDSRVKSAVGGCLLTTMTERSIVLGLLNRIGFGGRA